MKRSNYIQDVNRFNLAGPPDFWLLQLHEFDSSLVVVPSRQGFYYRLAQRRKLQLPEHMTNAALWHDSDTHMLARYSLIPVTTILATANWSNPYIFVELANRAPWRMGGAGKVNKILEDQDKRDALDKRVATDEHLTALSKDAWKLYRTKIGLGRSWNNTPSAVKPVAKPIVSADKLKLQVGFSRPDKF